MLLSIVAGHGSAEVDLGFIKSENIDSSWTHSFFCCSVNSDILIWEIDGVGIGTFNHLEDVIARRTTLHGTTTSNYFYYASLLSMRSNQGQDSMLTVTASTGSTVNVTCLNDRAFKTISNQVDPMNTEDNEPIRNASVNLQPVFLTNTIVVNDGNNVTTKAFICDVNNSSDLSWEADTSNTTDHLALNSNSHIGTSESRLTDDGDTLKLQAISVNKQKETFYSLLYVTDKAFEEVRCLANGHAAKYSVRKSLDTTSTFQIGMYANGRREVNRGG